MTYRGDIVALAKQNEDFRRVYVTGRHSQVVLMSVVPGAEIGEETRTEVDQTLVFVSGEEQAILNGEKQPRSS